MASWRFLFGSLGALAAMGCGRAEPRVFGQGGGGGTTPIRGAFGNTEVAVGDQHTCARSIYGDITCWGDNAHGQLGAAGVASSPTPVAVKLPARARSVASGAFHSCAVLEDERVYCWGRNDQAELGTLTGHDEPTPIQVPLPTGHVTALALGFAHSCLLQRDKLSDSTLYCWGSNQSGEVGDGTKTLVVGTPSEIALHVPEASAGRGFSVGIFKVFMPDGESTYQLTGWGQNATGALGFMGPGVGTPQSTAVLGLSHIAAGPGGHACAIFDGQGMTPGAYCWGSNAQGQLGTGAAGPSALPGPVIGLPSVVDRIAPGEQSTCALAAGTVYCWGANAFGQLGNGTAIPSLAPVAIPTLKGIRSISVGRAHACAVVADADIECWGANGLGQLGDGTTTPRLSPVKVALPG